MAMNVREKLIKLFYDNNMICDQKIEGLTDDVMDIIAHEVTVQEWISVEDELPKEQGYYRVYHKNSKSISDRFYYKDCPDLFVNVMDDPITYWKPIEQPPKGE